MMVGVARIAVVLARTWAARRFNIDEISADAMALERLSRDARRALLAQTPIEPLAAEASVIAERYGAELIADADPEVFVFGLRFRDGTFSGPMRNIFAVL